MKTIPPPCPEPESGIRYWRSLDHAADSPDFRRWLESEFPAGVADASDALNRRHFIKIMSASFMLAGLGLTGCRRPEENILPFSRLPDNYVHGKAQFYATSIAIRGHASPLLVKSYDGRPIKAEGNPTANGQIGGTDHFAQASLLGLYDPDRAMRFTRAGQEISRPAAMDALAQIGKELVGNQGKGAAVLMEKNESPSLARLREEIQRKSPQIRWFAYEPLDYDMARQGASAALGRSVIPTMHLDKAKVIVALDSDFLGAEEDAVRMTHGYAKGRRIQTPTDSLNRLYVVENSMSLTGANADHRLRLSSAQIQTVAARLADAVLRQLGPSVVTETATAVKEMLSRFGTLDSTSLKWIEECAKDLCQRRGECVVMAGYRQPLEVHVLAHTLNVLLGNVGLTVVYREVPTQNMGTITQLAQSLKKGEVETLIVLGGNPVYNVPSDLDWAITQRKAKNIVRLGDYEDETFPVCDLHFPRAHYLEAWGDNRSANGSILAVQPLMEPLFGGMGDLEFLARFAGLAVTNPYEIVRETLKQCSAGLVFEESWKQFLNDGYLENSDWKVATVALAWDGIAQAVQQAQVYKAAGNPDALEVNFYRSYSVDDGRFANNGWLQELPDPITKLVWDNAFTLSPKTALDRQLKEGDVVRLECSGKNVEGPVFIQPGNADNTISVSLGYGRLKAGRVGHAAGFNSYLLRTSGGMHFAPGASLKKTGATFKFATTQSHGAMEGRPIIREANLEQFREHPDFAANMDLDAHMPQTGPLYQHPTVSNPKLKGLHQWGMVIDLNACVGCTACMTACQSENNVPIVGKDQVARGREMHWIRIDRYYTTTTADRSLADPQVVNQPMLCQHCENAPCENVCPVNATIHDEEGLNVMAYNRCVGTRYCSNNCPYKVRRFNYFDFNKRPLDKLYQGPLASRPADEMEFVKMVKNPDVTVRMRGIMEKCSFCIQRIEQGKIGQKIKAGASGDVRVPDGTITPACAQACPAEAIVFGDVADPDSRVSTLKKLSLNYSVLGFLYTKPRTTYLARVRNPNPAMPDYRAMPSSLEEYSNKNGSPFESSEHHDSSAPSEHSKEPAEKGAH